MPNLVFSVSVLRMWFPSFAYPRVVWDRQWLWCHKRSLDGLVMSCHRTYHAFGLDSLRFAVGTLARAAPSEVPVSKSRVANGRRRMIPSSMQCWLGVSKQTEGCHVFLRRFGSGVNLVDTYPLAVHSLVTEWNLLDQWL